MNIDRYQKEAITTAVYPERGSGSFMAVAYCALGIAGEAGEVAEQVKKAWRNDSEITPERREKIIDEMGDVMWYVASMCEELDIYMSEVMAGNLRKLAARKEKGLLKEHS